MLAKDVRAGKKSCLSNANDDEPVFVLRAQDELAPFCLEFWADALEAAYKEAPRLDDDVHAKIIAKIDHARAEAHLMRAWQALNGSKLPD